MLVTELSDSVPSLEPGVTLLETPDLRTTALHHVALSHLYESGGSGHWIDSRGNAATYLLDQEHRPTLELQIARAFTAYQHYELVRTLPGDLGRDVELLVLPCLPSLYADNDVPDWSGEEYLQSALRIIVEVAEVIELPVLVSATTGNPFVDQIRKTVDSTITFELTDLGYRFEAPGFETTVYWGDGYWQTTIPYWVELLGAVDEATPAIAADEAGMLPGIV